MNGLRALQRRFQDYVLAPRPGPAEADVVSDERAGARARLDVYADAYRLRLIEVLGDNYPALHAVLGDEQFDALARAYIDRHPSHHPSVRWYGAGMAGFLAGAAPWSGQPVLAELAAFEWALRAAFDAADAAPLAPDALATLAPERWPDMRLRLHPSLGRLDLRWNAPALWKAIDAGEDPPAPEPGAQPLAWAVWRSDLRQYFRSLDVAEAWALDAARAGEPFAAICEGLCEWIDAGHVAAHGAGLIKRWLTDGLIIRVDA